MDPGRPLRVAVLSHTGARSGAELALLRLVRNLDRDLVRVHAVIFAPGPLVDSLREIGIEVTVLELDESIAKADRNHLTGSAPTRLAGAWRVASFVVRLARILRALDVDVVHCNSLKSDILGGIAARLARRRVVWYVHDRISADYLPARTAAVFRAAIRLLPHQVLANSQATLATLGRFPARRSAVAYPGVEQSAFAFVPRAGGGAATVGMVGRISPTKGQDVFLRAAAAVRVERPDTRFVVVGSALFNEAGFEQEMHVLADDLGLRGCVRFAGHVADVRAETAAFSALVHASPTPEPFGQVIVEAMAAGIPVIATSGGGVGEITGRNGELAVVVPPGDVAALAEAMRQILDRPDDARLRAERARAMARTRFGIDTTVREVCAAWTRAARRPVGQRAMPSSNSA